MNLLTKYVVYLVCQRQWEQAEDSPETLQTPGELTSRKLKSGGRKNNTKSLSFESTELVVKSIKQYAEHHALCLPGRVPGLKRDEIQKLPLTTSKSQIYRHFAEIAEIAGIYLWHFKCVLWRSVLCITSWLFYFLFFTCYLSLTALCKDGNHSSKSVTRRY